MTPVTDDQPFKGHIRSMVANMLPGVVLPTIIYFTLRSSLGVLLALVAASCVPGVDALVRLVRGGRRTGSPSCSFPRPDCPWGWPRGCTRRCSSWRGEG